MPEITVEQAIHIAFGHFRAGRSAAAEALYRQILSITPHQPDALHVLGVLSAQAGRFQVAVDLLRRAVMANPAGADIRVNFGNALRQSGNLKEAIAVYRQAVALHPDFAPAARGLSEALAAADAEFTSARQGVRLRPQDADAHRRLAVMLFDKGELDESLKVCQEALRLKPDLVEALNTLGNILEEKGRIHEALAAYDKILRLTPQWPEMHWNVALVLLRLGSFPRGWAEYEWRWKCRHHSPSGPRFSEPRWDGSPLPGKAILLHSEQGNGDAIQFVRYAALVAQKGGRVMLGCSTPLFRLMQGAIGVDEVVRVEPLPHFDVECPLMSLPMILGTRVGSIPADVPYLRVNSDLAKSWGEKVAATGARLAPSPPYSGERAGVRDDFSSGVDNPMPFDAPPLTLPSPPSTGEREILAQPPRGRSDRSNHLRIGVAWAGGPNYGNDRKRSLLFSQLAPLAKVPNVTFYSLQKGPAAAEARNIPPGMHWIDLTNDLNDFADTAALISHLDLVISVDTAVAHLAGALGKPVWVLLPAHADWRWLLDRDDSPWYPTMRLIRQKTPGDWAQVIERVVAALERQRQWLK